MIFSCNTLIKMESCKRYTSTFIPRYVQTTLIFGCGLATMLTTMAPTWISNGGSEMFNISFHGKQIKQNEKHLINVKAHHGIGRYNEAREEASYQSHGPVKEGAKWVGKTKRKK